MKEQCTQFKKYLQLQFIAVITFKRTYLTFVTAFSVYMFPQPYFDILYETNKTDRNSPITFSCTHLMQIYTSSKGHASGL